MYIYIIYNIYIYVIIHIHTVCYCIQFYCDSNHLQMDSSDGQLTNRVSHYLCKRTEIHARDCGCAFGEWRKRRRYRWMYHEVTNHDSGELLLIFWWWMSPSIRNTPDCKFCLFNDKWNKHDFGERHLLEHMTGTFWKWIEGISARALNAMFLADWT